MIPILKSIDMFGVDFKLNIKGKETFTTILGGIFTVILGMITIVLAWYFGKDLYLKENPSYLSKTTYKHYAPMYYLNYTNFFFALHVEDFYGLPIHNESFFHFQFKYVDIENDPKSGTVKKINKITSDCEKCSTVHIDNDTLNSKGLNDFYCSDLNGLKLGGDWETTNIVTINYMVERCTPEWAAKRNISCASKEDFDKLGPLYFSYYYFRNLLDPEDYVILY